MPSTSPDGKRKRKAPWFLRRWAQRLRFALRGDLLCDTCRFDYRDACRRPQRPNAKVCPDYERGGASR